MNNEKQFLEQLKEGQIKSQKRGIHFILASVILWTGIAVVRIWDLPVLTQNLFTFFMSAPLMPLGYFFSRLLKIQFNDKENPLTSLGILLALAQMPYLLIVMGCYLVSLGIYGVYSRKRGALYTDALKKYQEKIDQ